METEGDPRADRLVVGFLRFYADMTQAAFGKAAGIHQGDQSRYENGKLTPSEQTLRRMAAAADLPWFLVVHLRRFYSALLAAADRRAAIARGAEPPAGAVQEPALLAVSAYRLEDAAAEAGRQAAEQAPVDAEQVWAELARLPSRRRRRAIELSLRASEKWRAALLVQVCEASVRAAAHRPEEALELASLALFIAERKEGDEGRRRRLMGFAWAYVANARRVANDLDGANAAFIRAWELWRSGAPSDPELLPEWRLLDLEASLRREERRFQRALDLLRQALAASRDNPAAAGRILLKKEFVLEQMGDVEGAVAVLGEAAPYVEASKDPRLLFGLRFNLVDNLSHLERYAEAAALLPEVRELAQRLADELSLLRVAWLEARVAAGQGRTEEAAAGLERVRRGFAGHGMPYDAALAALDLAVLWLKAGRTAQVRELALEMEAIFKANGIDREARAACLLFCDAARRETATVELARRAIAEIERARRS